MEISAQDGQCDVDHGPVDEGQARAQNAGRERCARMWGGIQGLLLRPLGDFERVSVLREIPFVEGHHAALMF
jgi:hypothetical protein